jgi:hypothetical protein
MVNANWFAKDGDDPEAATEHGRVPATVEHCVQEEVAAICLRSLITQLRAPVR